MFHFVKKYKKKDKVSEKPQQNHMFYILPSKPNVMHKFQNNRCCGFNPAFSLQLPTFQYNINSVNNITHTRNHHRVSDKAAANENG